MKEETHALGITESLIDAEERRREKVKSSCHRL